MMNLTERAAREQLQRDGVELLKLIGAELRKQTDANVSVRPKRLKVCLLPKDNGQLTIGGKGVPLLIGEQYVQSCHMVGCLQVSVAGIRDENTCKSVVSARTWTQNYRTRDKNYGFSPKSIAAYCLKWLELRAAQDVAEAMTKARLDKADAKADAALEQWQKVLATMTVPKGVEATATPQGIRLKMTVDAKRAQAVFAALGGHG